MPIRENLNYKLLYVVKYYEKKALKINVAQRILSISDNALLQKIKNLLDEENVFAHDSDGNPITGSDYIKNLDAINRDIDNGTAELFSTKEVLKRIANDNKLAL